MITGLEVGNVRIFEDFGLWKFPLTKINVFCGTNSAGKSTILKSLLLLMQSHDVDPTVSSGQLRLAGPLVDLGNYRSFVSHHDVSRDIELALTIEDLVETRRLRRLRAARKHPAPVGVEEEYTDYHLESAFRFGVVRRKREDQEPTSQLPFGDEDANSDSWTSQAYLKEANFRFNTRDGLGLNWKVFLRSERLGKGEDPDFDILIPADYFAAYGGHNVMDIEKGDIHGDVKIECFLRGILPGGLWARQRRPLKTDEEEQWSFFPLPSLISSLCSDIADSLSEIHYIGPLRSPARRFYLTTSDATPQMDSAGEFLPYVLRDQGDKEIRYVPPGAVTVEARPLKKAVDEWLYYLRTGRYASSLTDISLHEIDFTSLKDVLLEFTLQSFTEETHALADSGFGYSQLLPIVVRGLIADFEDTIAIEQPELHLNPALQVRIAEFLASLARAGKVLMIETHSEHIVNAIRVLAAEDVAGTLASECRILYIDIESGVPILKHLQVLPNGTVPEWPRGFMGEAMHLSSRLLKAQEQRRSKTGEGA